MRRFEKPPYLPQRSSDVLIDDKTILTVRLTLAEMRGVLFHMLGEVDTGEPFITSGVDKLLAMYESVCNNTPFVEPPTTKTQSPMLNKVMFEFSLATLPVIAMNAIVNGWADSEEMQDWIEFPVLEDVGEKLHSALAVAQRAVSAWAMATQASSDSFKKCADSDKLPVQ